MRSGKCSLTSDGSSTLATAPPASAEHAEQQEDQIEPDERAQRPGRSPRRASAATSSRCGPKRAGQPRRERAEPGEADHRQRREQPGDAAAGVQAVLEVVEHRADAGDGRPHRQAGQRERDDEQHACCRTAATRRHAPILPRAAGRRLSRARSGRRSARSRAAASRRRSTSVDPGHARPARGRRAGPGRS